MDGGEHEFHKLDTSFHETLFLGVKKKAILGKYFKNKALIIIG